MKWYFEVRGGHTHVRVFMNGAKCGDLVFRNEEFDAIKTTMETLGAWKVDAAAKTAWLPYGAHLITFLPEQTRHA